jgi:hypothetical protein
MTANNVVEATGGKDMKGRSVRLTVMSLLLTTVAIAGMQMAFECNRCGLTEAFSTGGGFRFQQMTCFCTNCSHIVSVTWKRGGAVPKPVTYQLTHQGAVPIYQCPRCFKDTARQWGQKLCPKCGSTNTVVKGTGEIYD